MAKIPYEQINLLELEPPSFLNENDKNAFTASLAGLLEVRNFLDKIDIVFQIAKVPTDLSNGFKQLKDEFTDYYSKMIVETKNKSTEELARTLIQNSNSVKDYRNKFFEANQNNRNLFICNSILSFANNNYEESLSKITLLINSLDKEITRADLLNKELEEKSTRFVVSNYAKIFEHQELKNQKTAVVWLYTSIIFSFVSITLLFLSFKYDWFNITSFVPVVENNQSFTKQIYNYPNLITKVFIISIIIYLMSFFFKQYSINRHLQTLNNHRKNALNSYILFAESIGEKNIADKSALMLQVSKAIYENTATGYLSSKQSTDGPNSFIELTKFVTDNRQS